MIQPEEIRISVIVDNTPLSGFSSEHGFSLWIEAGGSTLLFDTGRATAFASNLRQLDIELSRANMLVLSHGHYDHTGGVAHVLQEVPAMKVCMHPGALTRRWSIREGVAKPTDMPADGKEAIRALNPSQILNATGPMEILPGIWVTGPVPRVSKFEDPGGPFFLDTEGAAPDAIEDDLSLWIKTTEGLVIIAGCCHSGLVNTINYIRTVSGEKRIASVVGGLHLSSATTERLENTVQALKKFSIGRIHTSHCTGNEATELFAHRLGCPVSATAAGLRLTP
ncbi:MAG: MBL fold metallo-hydrolase [Chlorobium phaeovibrioides]|nr:MBL fold metallo-hydrolase [Chlorobium phaeovibrioides]